MNEDFNSISVLVPNILDPEVQIPLAYNIDVNSSSMTNIMLVDSSVSEAQIFYDSANSNTFPIMYSYTSKKTELLEVLRKKFQQGIKRIAFIFHDPSVMKKVFLDNTVFFNDSDLETNQTTFSENVTFLKDLVQEFSIENYDFLACNTLQYPIWKQYYDFLQTVSYVKCGASNDATGNIQSGADWVMENTNEDIKNIYFTDSINNYSSTLAATTISNNGGTIYIQYVLGTGLQYKIGTGGTYTNIGTNYPINIQNTGGSTSNILTVRFATDLIIDNVLEYFVCTSSYITFDGSRSGVPKGTVTVTNVPSYPGLIQDGTSGVTGFHTITVQNIQSSATGTSTLVSNGGWICQQYFGSGVKTISGFNPSTNYININNCSNSGNITNNNSGGICGFAFSNNGTATVSNCSNSQIINGLSSGGICAPYIGQNSGTVTISSCSNSAIIQNNYAGGICGSATGITNGTVTITDCSNTGLISGLYAGGICGHYTGHTNSIVNISNCSNSGNITATNSGGICPQYTGYLSTVNISYCSNSGNITGSNSGGICGPFAGINNGTIAISYCYNSGLISGQRCGGITGQNFGDTTNKLCSITNSYSISNITGSNSGGICGASIGFNSTGIMQVTNCYTLGSIATTCGGILGGTNSSTYTSIPTVTLTNCYSNGNITDANSGLIANSLQIKGNAKVTTPNCYIGNNGWTDAAANAQLTGEPTSVTIGNPGTTWTSTSTNTPYLLSAFNSQLYNPNSVIIRAFNYTSSPGVITSGYTYSIVNSNKSISTTLGINSANGVLTFTNIPSDSTITTNVIASKYDSNSRPYNYNINNITITNLITTISNNGGTVYINYDSVSGLQYKIGSSGSYSNIGANYAINIVNTNGSLSNILTVRFESDIIITSVGTYFVCGSSYITFDGSRTGVAKGTVTISNVSSYPGLIQNGTAEVENSYHSISVQNIQTVASGTSTLLNSGGWICQQYFGKNIKNISGFDPLTNYININNCSNSGSISGNSTGGICGTYSGYNGIITISSCSNSGNITATNSGGICGAYAGETSGTVTISSCFNSGELSGVNSGGIAGASFGYNTNQLCSITNSYSIGSIIGSNAGGICGSSVGLNNTSGYSPIVQITNCYTLGSIVSTCGGILGGSTGTTYTNTPTVTLTNCYSNGTVTDVGSGLISNNLSIKGSITTLNCYIGNNAWSDTSANAVLTGTPTDINTNNPAATWTSIASNTPYIFSLYNSQLYEPNFVVTTTNYYTSSQGLIQPDYTYSIVNSNKLPRTIIYVNASNGIINFQNIKFNPTPIITNVIASKYDSNGNPYNYNVNTFTITHGICFKEDSEILCLIENEEMYVKVQDLKPNMLVKTCEETYVPIDTIGWFHLVNEIDTETNRHPDGLYELTKETYPELTENLVLTGRHAILLDTLKNEHLNEYKFARHIKLYNKYKLPCVANENAKPYKNGTFKIWSLCLQAEDETKNYGIYANGLLVESTNKKDMKNNNLNLVE